ncbi:MAG: tetratricopeptide repeat protein [Thermomicrobiales bacterium]|jgi:predicted ATPase/DNA-binding CsgD family transcriptional regulator|nr:tetratricopeptide repeat protein [Thermomicrobiales bacterium]
MSIQNGTHTTVSQSAGRLPPHPSELIGRDSEVESLVAMLRDPAARLITLTGPGGVGKTRLSLAVADRSVGLFPGGIWFVSLATVDTIDLVLPEIASELGVRDVEGDETVIRIAERLGNLPALVILDNLEHVIAVSPEIAHLLQISPALKVISTTREPLMVRGEIAYPVHPLATEPLENDGLSAAEQLFVTRASESNYGFEATPENVESIREICRRLAGIPLAIELAATWVKVLPPQRLLANLDRQLDVLVRGARDLPPRQQTMRSTIEWSYRLLTEEQQALFRALSIFGGEFTLTDAEAVAQPRKEESDGFESVDPWRSLQTLEGLSSLVSKSLAVARTDVVDPTEPQYELLETIRAFGHEQLREAGEEAIVQRRFLQWYASLGQRWSIDLVGLDRRKRLAQFDLEYPNFRAALNLAVETGDVETGHRMIIGLWRYWDWRGLLNEGNMWCDRILALRGEVSPQLRARALYGAATLPFSRGNYDLALHRSLECLEIAEASGDEEGVGFGANALGNVYYDTGRYDLAAEAYARGLTARRTAGTRADLKVSVVNLAWVYVQIGEYERARSLFDEALGLVKDDSDSNGTAWALNGLGLLAWRTGDFAAAGRHWAEAAQLQRAEDTGQLASALAGLAAVKRQEGELEEALRLDRESLKLRVDRDEMGGIPESLSGFAYTVEKAGQPQAAAMLLGAVEQLRHRISLGVPDAVRLLESQVIARLKDGLGDVAFASAWKKGSQMSMAEAGQFAFGLSVIADVTVKSAPVVRSAGPAVTVDLHGLTTRELEVLGLIVAGMTDRQIADELFISTGTASRHVANILHKLDVKSRSAAAAWAIRNSIG